MLIKGGKVVDGTGAPGFEADVRVADGLIAEVGAGLEPAAGEEVVDAAGCVVTPGLIESHTHFDGIMWWQPDLDPLPGCGGCLEDDFSVFLEAAAEVPFSCLALAALRASRS